MKKKSQRKRIHLYLAHFSWAERETLTENGFKAKKNPIKKVAKRIRDKI